MDLRTIKIKSHPSREIFRKHKVPVKVVAKALELSYNHVVGMLSGSIKVTPKTERKLKEFCEELERD
jgi:hypothetical protein